MAQTPVKARPPLPGLESVSVGSAGLHGLDAPLERDSEK